MQPFKRVKKGDPLFRSASFYVRFQIKGRPYLWSTKTNDINLAKKRGKTYRDAIIAESYQLVDAMKTVSGSPTFDRLFDAYRQFPSPSKKTKTVNIGAMRLVMASSGLTGSDRLDRLSAQTVLKHQQAMLAARPGVSAAIVSCNGHIRRARSLFSRRAMVSYTLKMPEEAIASFFKVPMLKESEKRPELPTAEALERAQNELPFLAEYYRAYLLGRYAGLRAGEAAAARKDWIEVKRSESGEIIGGMMHIGGREFVAKSRRWRSVALPVEIITTLMASPFDYLVGEHPAEVLRNLPAILRGYGFPDNKPYHSLRRLYGSVIYTQYGPRHARENLGHREQSTTDRFYARSLDTCPPVAFVG